MSISNTMAKADAVTSKGMTRALRGILKYLDEAKASGSEKLLEHRIVCPNAVQVLRRIGSGAISMDDGERAFAGALVLDRANATREALRFGALLPLRGALEIEPSDAVSWDDLKRFVHGGIDYMRPAA